MIADAANVPVETIVTALQGCVDRIIMSDGDRDHMNHSDLTVEQTLAMSDLIRVAIVKLTPQRIKPQPFTFDANGTVIKSETIEGKVYILSANLDIWSVEFGGDGQPLIRLVDRIDHDQVKAITRPAFDRWVNR